MKAVSTKGTFDYVLEADKELPESEQTICVCSYLTIEQVESLQNRSQENFGTTLLSILHMGLKDIKNFFDDKGEPIKMERDQSKKADVPGVGRPWKSSCLEFISEADRIELAGAIRNAQNLSEEEVKNSASCPGSSSEK